MSNGQYEVNNEGATVFSVLHGTQNIYFQKLEDRFQGGLEALKNRMYPLVVQRFEDYLSTATSAEVVDGQPVGGSLDGTHEMAAAASLARMSDVSASDVEEKMARAHVLASIGLLNRNAPNYSSFDVLYRIDQHLELARKLGRGRSVYALASVLWAIVKDDGYEYQGLDAPAPPAEELRREIPGLDAGDIELLKEHVAPAQGATWPAFVQHANATGHSVAEVVSDDAPRLVEPGRPEKVRKYFTRTPDPVSQVPFILAFAGVALLVILGLAAGNVLVFLLLAAVSFWPAKLGIRHVGTYQEYRRKLAAAEPKPTDEQMNAWLTQDIQYITRKAGRRLRLNPKDRREGGDLVVKEQVVVGIPLHGEAGRPLRVRWGGDGQLRSDYQTILVLLLTDRMVSTYRCVLDVASSDILLDETHEYHYTDIVGVSSTSVPLNRPIQDLVDVVAGPTSDISLVHEFKLSLVNREFLPVPMSFGGRFEQRGNTTVWRGNDQAARVIQTMVRSRHAR
jgi:hypothetical protein